MKPGECRPSAHFPKSALHRPNTFSRTSESHGHQQIHDSSAAFNLKSLNRILQRVSQGLRIGGTRRSRNHLTKHPASVPISGVRVIVRQPVLRTSESKDTSNLLL